MCSQCSWVLSILHWSGTEDPFDGNTIRLHSNSKGCVYRGYPIITDIMQKNVFIWLWKMWVANTELHVLSNLMFSLVHGFNWGKWLWWIYFSAVDDNDYICNTHWLICAFRLKLIQVSSLEIIRSTNNHLKLFFISWFCMLFYCFINQMGTDISIIESNISNYYLWNAIAWLKRNIVHISLIFNRDTSVNQVHLFIGGQI